MEPATDTPSTPSAAPAQAPPKFSRYRSVRQAAAKAQAHAEAPVSSPAPALPNTQQNDVAAKPKSETIARSMSRYRRARQAATTQAPVPSVPTSIPPKQPQPVTSPPMPDHGFPQVTPQQAEAQEKLEKLNLAERNLRKEDAVPSRQVVDDDDERELSAQEKERMRQEAMERLTGAGRPQTARARDSSRSREPQHHPQRPPEKRREERQPPQENTEQKRLSWKEKLGFSRPKTHADGRQPHDTSKKDATKEPGGGFGPGIDAPISAVNSGERRVLVKCNASSINLPVTPTTRARDIIFSALNCLSEPDIDPNTAILLESFSLLGLERPLRRYEHVRDVMNSWATDTQNSLIITPPSYDGAGERLEVEAAPREQPKDATFHLYHSQKPGKWDKRYVTLRSDGQVSVSKKPDGQEATNICHLSDFDIYSPTHRETKKLKPPKKLCFAIKSQQKSSMFISTENFVHFFATSDAELAQNWYDAVHGWRSWYLVNILGEGQKQNDSSNSSKSGDLSRSASRRKRNSCESTPYQLGSFTPLLDIDSVGRNEDTSSNKKAGQPSTTQEMYLRKKQTRTHAPPPSSFPMSLAADTEDDQQSAGYGKTTCPRDDDSETFSPTGLLGRTYSLRKEAQREREAKLARENSSEEPVFSGLLKNLGSPTSPSSANNPISNPPSRQPSQASRSNTMRSIHPPEFDKRGRSNSNRQQPKPLVDLTPVFREPPQHSRKGHGVKVAPGVPLVEAATGPELAPGAVAIPPATTWRRPEAQSRPATAREASSARHRANSARSQHQMPQNNLVSDLSSPVSPENPFTPSSLLARSMQPATSSSTTGIGRGVATGDRNASKPLLDMTPKSEFAEGSLLRNLEKGL